MKVCSHCQRRLTDDDLLQTESRSMEAARIAAGLEGLCFRYYTCPRCGFDHVFLEIVPLPEETPQDLHARKQEMAHAVQEVSALRTAVMIEEP
jgi:hypothetical protein